MQVPFNHLHGIFSKSRRTTFPDSLYLLKIRTNILKRQFRKKNYANNERSH